MTYGLIGVGAIATAIVSGMSDGAERPPTILLSSRNASRAAELASRYGNVQVCTSNQAVVDGASTLILCLRPQDAPAALRTLRFSTDQSIISVMAGISIDALRAIVAPATAIARCIPLPSVASREGVTVILPPGGAAKALFDQLGEQSNWRVNRYSMLSRRRRRRSPRTSSTWTRSAAGSPPETSRPAMLCGTSRLCSSGSHQQCAAARAFSGSRKTIRRRAGSTSCSSITCDGTTCTVWSTTDCSRYRRRSPANGARRASSRATANYRLPRASPRWVAPITGQSPLAQRITPRTRFPPKKDRT